MVGQVCRTVKHTIDFSIFDLGGLPLGRRSPKGEITYYPPRSTILQNFSPIAQTVFEICVTKVFQSLALIFYPLKSSKIKSDSANQKSVGPTYKCSVGSNLISVTICEIFRVKILTVDLLTLAGLTTGPKFVKGEMTWWTPRSTVLQNFIALCQPAPEISVTKILRTGRQTDKQTDKKQTVNDISPACLSACGDKNCNSWVIITYYSFN